MVTKFLVGYLCEWYCKVLSEKRQVFLCIFWQGGVHMRRNDDIGEKM